jgi:uncharacterized protein YqeY
VSFLLHGFGLDLIQILSLNLDQFFRRRSDRKNFNFWNRWIRGIHATAEKIRLVGDRIIGHRFCMSSFVETLSEDIKNAMRAKDSVALNTLRALKSALTNASIEKGGLGTPLEEAECLAIVRKQIKQRQDSIEQFEKAGRAELADNEKSELAILQKFLPAALSESEVAELLEKAVAETGATSKADMGKVMKVLQELVDGRADGRTLSQAVMKRLS